MQKAIEIDGLSLFIGKKQILSGINASVIPGTIVGLLGPSGAGKTTLIRAILGLQKPSQGSITVLGMKSGSRPLKTKIGYVTQAPSVYDDLTVQENIEYFAALLKANDDIDAVIEKVHMQKFKDRVVSDLSGGETARVSLAAALLGRPELLLLDEPTVGLDPVLRQKLWISFKQLAKSGVTILIASHVMDEAEKCDDLMFMRDGKLLISDSKENVLKKTKASSMEEAFLELAVGASHGS